MTAAAIKPYGFIYRLRHHTETPAKTTTRGSKNWLVIRTQFIWARVIVTRRSSSCLGRIEIKSSSDASQSIVFNARSLLPLNLMNEFAAHDEPPTTTKRPFESCLLVL